MRREIGEGKRFAIPTIICSSMPPHTKGEVYRVKLVKNYF